MRATHFIICFFVFLFSVVQLASGELLSADDVAYRVYHRDVGRDMQMTGTMELISSRGQKRRREYKSLRLDDGNWRKVLIRFTAPADIAGTGFLVLENIETGTTEQHLYLPALKRTRRIVTSQQGRKFVNSDFTYENMHRQPLENWSYKLDKKTQYMGRQCFTLLSTPLALADTRYSCTISLIDAATYMPLKIDFYNTDNQHCKTYLVKKVTMIDGIATELEVVMKDLLSQHTTRLFTKQLRYNNNLSDSFFTVRYLEQ